ncbi:MAG: antibiotic biosynthesis monooxygenase family protein [Hymenobacter sp.]
MNQAAQPADLDEVIVLLTLQFKPGSAAKVLERMVPSVRITRTEPGNNDFQLFKVNGSEDKVIVFERWKSQAALEWHWEQPYTKEALALFNEYLVAPLLDAKDVLHLTDEMKRSEQELV